MGISFLKIVFLSLWLSACFNANEGQAVATPREIGAQEDMALPSFSGKLLKGGTGHFSQYKGKVVLINFWATWCGPCRTEMPSMEALYRAFPRKDFEILAISIDTDSAPSVRAFVDELGVTFPIWLDDELIINDLLAIRVLPTSLIIDKNGVVVHRILGAKDWNDPVVREVIGDLVRKQRGR